MAPREREITVTLTRRVWAEFQRRIDAAGLRGERGAHSTVINDWLAEALAATGQGAPAGAPPPPAAPTALDDDDELDFNLGGEQ
jgi:hypothetical protein